MRALTLLGGLAIEAVVFAVLLAAAPATRQAAVPSAAAGITCESVQPTGGAV